LNSRLPGARVLLVEDELLVSWVAQDMLTDQGCVVLGPAASVHRALATIQAEAIDAAVLDINLDGELSYPVADALSALGVPYVFVTGYYRDRIPDAYRSIPVLQKPLRQSELGEAVARLLAAGGRRGRGAGNGADAAPPAPRSPGAGGESPA
jgi:DNA-binding NtrC family response regulator